MPEIIWSATLDDVYEVVVERNGTSTGILKVSKGGKLLGQCSVGLAYGAMFGPDISNVAEWEDWSSDFVDGKSSPIQKVES